MFGIIIGCALLGQLANAGQPRAQQIEFDDQRVRGVNLGIEVRGRRTPTEDDAKRMSERIFEQIEALVLEIDPTEK